MWVCVCVGGGIKQKPKAAWLVLHWNFQLEWNYSQGTLRGLDYKERPSALCGSLNKVKWSKLSPPKRSWISWFIWNWKVFFGGGQFGHWDHLWSGRPLFVCTSYQRQPFLMGFILNFIMAITDPARRFCCEEAMHWLVASSLIIFTLLQSCDSITHSDC